MTPLLQRLSNMTVRAGQLVSEMTPPQLPFGILLVVVLASIQPDQEASFAGRLNARRTTLAESSEGDGSGSSLKADVAALSSGGLYVDLTPTRIGRSDLVVEVRLRNVLDRDIRVHKAALERSDIEFGLRLGDKLVRNHEQLVLHTLGGFPPPPPIHCYAVSAPEDYDFLRAGTSRSVRHWYRDYYARYRPNLLVSAEVMPVWPTGPVLRTRWIPVPR